MRKVWWISSRMRLLEQPSA